MLPYHPMWRLVKSSIPPDLTFSSKNKSSSHCTEALSNSTFVSTLESYVLSVILTLNNTGYAFRMGTTLHLVHICIFHVGFSGWTQGAFQLLTVFSVLTLLHSTIFKCRLTKKCQPSKFPNPLRAKACFLTLLVQ